MGNINLNIPGFIELTDLNDEKELINISLVYSFQPNYDWNEKIPDGTVLRYQNNISIKYKNSYEEVCQKIYDNKMSEIRKNKQL
jgi:hypothetical protein